MMHEHSGCVHFFSNLQRFPTHYSRSNPKDLNLNFKAICRFNSNWFFPQSFSVCKCVMIIIKEHFMRAMKNALHQMK